MAYDASRATLNMVAVTPSDTTQVGLHGILVTGAGTLAIMPKGQEANATPTPVNIGTVAVGFMIRDQEISRVMATGTTATVVGFGPT